MSKKTIIDEDRLINEYRSGISSAALSKEFGCSRVTIYNRLKNLEVKPKTSKTIEDTKNLFIENGCKLLSSHFNVNEQYYTVEYVAQCGHQSVTKVDYFRKGGGRLCGKCMKQKRADFHKITSQEVESLLQQNGCKLLSKYNGCYKTIEYICQCGHKRSIKYYHFYRGQGRLCVSCSKSGISRMALDWIKSIEQKNGIIIQTAINGGEYVIPNTRIKVDGYCHSSNTVYEFYGDFWHGNPAVFNKDDVNSVSGKKFGELYHKTILREDTVKSLGYKLIAIWQSEWEGKNAS